MSSATKSCDLDSMPTKLLKQCLDIMLPLITLMINLSLQMGHFPTAWKEALILPLLKKLGLDLILKSFWPVSNLVFLAKICEKAVAVQYKDYCKLNRLYSQLQSAYRDDHSTKTALIKLQNDLLRAMNKDEVVLLLLLDLSAAFDTVSHEILLKRLSGRFGIHGTALKSGSNPIYVEGNSRSCSRGYALRNRTLNGECPEALYWGHCYSVLTPHPSEILLINTVLGCICTQMTLEHTYHSNQV